MGVHSGPYSRSKAMFAAIQAAIALPVGLLQHQAMSAIGTYRSRGHGEGCISNKHSRHTVAMDKRAALKARNKKRR